MGNFSTALQQLLYDFLAFTPNFVSGIIIFIASLYLAGLASKVLRRSLERRKTEKPL